MSRRLTSFQWAYVVIGALLFFLVTKEACVHPLTHDEGNTIYMSQNPIWDIITYKDPVPNNHILNTLLIKLNIAIFGDHLLVARAHNVLSFLLLLIFSYKLLHLWNIHPWLKILGFVLVLFQPYLLDFFAVTRGYGLSIAFMVTSLYYLAKHLARNDTKSLIQCFGWMSVAVYANFTILNVYVPLFFVLCLHIYNTYYKEQRSLFYWQMFYIIGIGTFLILLSILPIYRMTSTNQFVFWGSKGFLIDTWYPLMTALKSGVDYGSITPHAWGNYVLLIFTLSMIGAWTIQYRDKNSDKNFTYFSFLLYGIIGYNLLQYYVLNVPFLNARTALFLLPLVSFVFVYQLEIVRSKLSNMVLAFTSVAILIMSYHILSGAKVYANYEWYFDKHTYKVIEDLKSISEESGGKITLNCNWLFYPSLDYHVPRMAKEYIDLAPWGLKIDVDTIYQYYYADYGEIQYLEGRYEKIKDYNGSALMRRQ